MQRFHYLTTLENSFILAWDSIITLFTFFMNLITKLVLVVVYLLISIVSMAQSGSKSCAGFPSATALLRQTISETDNGKEVVEPYDGTYRFIFLKGIKQIFNDEIFKTIEQNRKDNEEVILLLSPYCKLQILSRRQINSSEFIPYSKSYVFEN